jgi:hypothetical protein
MAPFDLREGLGALMNRCSATPRFVGSRSGSASSSAFSRKTMEVEILKEALAMAQAKKPSLQLAFAAEGRFPMKTIANVLGVVRSHLHERVRPPAARTAKPLTRRSSCHWSVGWSTNGPPTAIGASPRW